MHVFEGLRSDVRRRRVDGEVPLLQEVDIGSSVEITLDSTFRQLSVHGKNRCLHLNQSVGFDGRNSSRAPDSLGTISGTVLGTAGFPQLEASRILRVLVAVRWPSGRRRRFAKVTPDPRTGLKSVISGPFFIASLVAVGYWRMVVGRRSGTLLGTLDAANVCLLGTQS